VNFFGGPYASVQFLIRPTLHRGGNLNPASNEFFASVENHLYGLGVLPQMNADELDIVRDFALQGFSAVACAEHIKKQRPHPK
jgi:hypothetical protein